MGQACARENFKTFKRTLESSKERIVTNIRQEVELYLIDFVCLFGYYGIYYGIFSGPAKRRVEVKMKWRVISESYDFGELWSSHAHTTPTFPNDHAQNPSSPDVFFEQTYWRVIIFFLILSAHD
jgi:hypothetical protein